MPRLRNDHGFMMVELLMAITVTVIALTALTAVFSSGIIAMRTATQKTTATLLADAQMETYRAMTFRDIGLDLSLSTVAALDSTYTNDPACAISNSVENLTCTANGVGGTETPPTGTLADSCTPGNPQINQWYPNTLPCSPSRVVNSSTTPASPDNHPYRIDTYIILVPAGTLSPTNKTEEQYKEVTVVVRDGTNLGRVYVRESSEFDCATGQVPNDTTNC